MFISRKSIYERNYFQTNMLKTKFSFQLNLNMFQFIFNLFDIVFKTIHTHTQNMYVDLMEQATLRKNCNQLVAVPYLVIIIPW